MKTAIANFCERQHLNARTAAIVGGCIILNAMAGAAFAQDWCEREVTLFRGGELVDTSALPVYIHGCDRFQYQPLTPQQVMSLGEHCSVESTASGGTEEEEVEQDVVTVEYGTTTETTPWGAPVTGENLTSNGISEAFGDNVLAVRSTVPQAVAIERLGGPTLNVDVGAGYTLVRDEGFAGSATYRATFSVQGGQRVKAAGPQNFDDLDTITTTVTVEREGNGALPRMPGPRTDRCGFFGEVIQ
jgi:hypothetical protein